MAFPLGARAVAPDGELSETGLHVRTLTTLDELDGLAGEWDELVRALPRPTPKLLHGWLREWWRVYGEGRELTVHVARQDGRLVGALPLFVSERKGLRVLEFVGASRALLADVLLADDAPAGVTESLAGAVAASRWDLADLVGLPGESRLAALLPGLTLFERLECPVLELTKEWPLLYPERFSKDARQKHRQKRHWLERRGRLEVRVATTAPELRRATAESFRLHALRWRDRPDVSGVLTDQGRRFFGSVYQALAGTGTIRIMLLLLDGEAIAYNAHFVLGQRVFLHRMGFDPRFAHASPGVLLLLELLERAAEDGVTRVEMFGNADPYKRQFATGAEPLYHGLLGRGVRGKAAAARAGAAIRVRRRLKRSSALRSLYLRAAAHRLHRGT